MTRLTSRLRWDIINKLSRALWPDEYEPRFGARDIHNPALTAKLQKAILDIQPKPLLDFANANPDLFDKLVKGTRQVYYCAALHQEVNYYRKDKGDIRFVPNRTGRYSLPVNVSLLSTAEIHKRHSDSNYSAIDIDVSLFPAEIKKELLMEIARCQEETEKRERVRSDLSKLLHRCKTIKALKEQLPDKLHSVIDSALPSAQAEAGDQQGVPVETPAIAQLRQELTTIIVNTQVPVNE